MRRRRVLPPHVCGRQITASAALISLLLATVFTLVAGTGTAQAITAPPGSADTSFNGSGRVVASGVTPFSSSLSAQFPSTDVARAAALQADGKLVVVGSTTPSGSTLSQFAVERFLPNGAPDPAFGAGGQVATPIIDRGTSPSPQLSAVAHAVTFGRDGTILVAGPAGVSTDYAVVRYNADGSVDSSFGGSSGLGGSSAQGIVVHCCNDPRGLVVQADGKILVGGSVVPGLGSYFRLNRLLADGSIDTAFGQSGQASAPFFDSTGVYFTDVANAMAVQPADGKIVLAGSSSASYSADRDFVVERFNTDGTLDTTFGGTGRVRTSLGSTSDTAASILVQPDGQLLAVGSASNGQSIAMARYNSRTGGLDAEFGQSGQVIYQDYWSSVTGAALQSDGRIVVVGGSYGVFVATRFDSTGALDTTFYAGAASGAVIGSGADTASAVAVQQDGRILAVGSTQRTDKYLTRTITSSAFGLARYASDGRLDASFGSLGVFAAPNITPFLTLPLTQLSSADIGRAVAVQLDGKVVAVGSTTPPGSTVPQFAVQRFSTNGTRDTSFGTLGRVGTAIMDTAVAPAVQTPAAAYAVAIQPDGKILVAGDGSTTDDAFAVVRYNANGSVDTSFGDPARDQGVVFRLGSTARALAVQTDGKILIAGTSRIGTGTGKGSEFTLTRLNPSGTLDSAFGPGGAAHALFHHEFSYYSTDVLHAMAVQPDGKILLAGSSNMYSPVNNDFALARFNADGTPDTGFGTGGQARTDLGSSSDTVFSLLIRRDTIVAVGTASNGQSIAIARYTSGGSLDTAFADNGEAFLPLANATLSGAVMQDDGRIVVAATVHNATDDFELLRINPGGNQDPTFGSGGVVTTSIGAGNDEANAVALQPDGKPLVVGWTQRTDTSVDGTAYATTVFALARYNAGPAGVAAAVTSPNSASFTVGQPGSFTVTATGQPTPALTLSGPVPTGLSFTDNGDGTGTLAGNPASTAGDVILTVTAHNGFAADAVQTFTAALAPGALDHLVLTPSSATVEPGTGQAFTADGVDGGGNSLGDETASTTFAISPDGTCTGATCTATSSGPHTVTGTSGGKTGTATLTVTTGPVHTVVVSPSSPSVAAGGTQAYAAEAFDQFGNDLGDVSPATTFTIAPDGTCTGSTCTATTAGPHTVTATYGAAAGTAAMNVTAGPQDHLLLTPATSSIAAGGGQGYAAEAFDPFGNDLGDVTSTTTFTIAPGGTCTGAACTATTAGPHTVTATNGGKTGVALLTVAAGPLDHLVLSPPTTSVPSGAAQSYTAQGLDQFGNPVGDMTSSTTFAISPDGSCTGDACTATTAGPHTVTGSSGGKTGTATLTVTAAVSRIVFSSTRDGNAEIYTMNPDGTAPTRLTQNLAADTFPSWSPDHRRIVFSSTRDGNGEIYAMNADGTGAVRLTRAKGTDTNPRWSPDGTRIVFSSTRDGNAEIYVMNADGSAAQRLTRVTAADTVPSWSPDGTRIVFSSTRDGNAEIYVMNANGTGVVRLTRAKGADTAPNWSADGGRVIFSSTRDGNAEIYAMNANGTGVVRLTRTAGADTTPSWSPDGSRIVFSSTRDGNAEIYVMNADGSGVARLTSIPAADTSPAW